MTVGALFCSVSAQTDSLPSEQPPASFLLVVETSRAMQPRAKGVYDSIKGLMDSNFRGQLRAGDKLGMWTCSDTLNKDWMAFQAWSFETRLTSSMRAARFSQSDAYGNRADFEKLVPEINKAIQQPGVFTVLLYTAGKNEIHGTPFDDQINASYKEWADQQQKANMPLITLLRAKDGKIMNWSVTPGPWAVELPAVPELQVTQKQEEAPALVVTRRARPLLSALSPESVLAAANKTETNSPPAATPTASAKPTEAKPQVASTAPTEAPQPATAPASTSESKNEPSAVPPANIVKPKPKNEVSVAAATPAPAPAPPPVVVEEKAAPVPAPTATTEKKSQEKAGEKPSWSAPTPVAENPPAVTPTKAPTRAGNPAPSSIPGPSVKESVAVSKPIEPPAVPAGPVQQSVPLERKTDIAQTESPVSQTPPPPQTAPAPQTVSEPGPKKSAPMQANATTIYRSALMESFVWMTILVLVGFVAAFCFAQWLRSFRRSSVAPVTLQDVLEKSPAPLITPLRRANLSAENVAASETQPSEPESAVMQE